MHKCAPYNFASSHACCFGVVAVLHCGLIAKISNIRSILAHKISTSGASQPRLICFLGHRPHGLHVDDLNTGTNTSSNTITTGTRTSTQVPARARWRPRPKHRRQHYFQRKRNGDQNLDPSTKQQAGHQNMTMLNHTLFPA